MGRFFCRHLSVVWFFILASGACFTDAHAHSGSGWGAELDRYLGAADAVVVSDPEGRVIFSKHADEKRIPASTLKLLTALTALDCLGETYRFPTEFYTDDQMNLWVKGFGDPLWISEAVDQMAATLSTRLAGFNDLVMDVSYFEHPIVIPGITSSLEPYDAPNSALCANFNTVYFKQNLHGDVISAEPQTPLLPIALQRIRTSGMVRGRIVLSAHAHECAWYAGQLLSYFLKKNGLNSNGTMRMGHVRPGAVRLVYRHRSTYSLTEVIAKLMTHSNNFIANQLLIAAGARKYGPPGTLEKGVRAASEYARHVLGLKGVKIVEGSGISRDNRMTAEQMDRVLESFAPYHALLRHQDGIYYKTGTLAGIRTRVGYIDRGNGRRCRFTIFLNTPGRSVQPVMKTILRRIEARRE